MKINEISNLINIRNYILLQTENIKTDKKVSLKLSKLLSELDVSINNQIIDHFDKIKVARLAKEAKEKKNNESAKQANI